MVTQKEASHGKAEKLSSLNPASPEFVEMAKKNLEQLTTIQSDLLEEIRDANQKWLDRIQSEAALASEFTSKLATSHSIADTTMACQEWLKRRVELFTEDGKHLMTDSQKFMEKAARFFPIGWFSNGRTGGSS